MVSKRVSEKMKNNGNLGAVFDEDEARTVGGIIKMELQEFRCDDSFIAQQRLVTKPGETMKLERSIVHVSMKTMMETLSMAVAKPPVISTKIAFAGEELERFQRLEWPKMLCTGGNIIMANGQKVKIQACRLVATPAARQRHREATRAHIVQAANDVGIEFNSDKDLAWAVIDELAHEIYQADIRPASEIPADEVVVIDEDVLVELDSGLSSTRITPTSPHPQAIPIPPSPVVARVPVPSARPPTPPVPPPRPEETSPIERPTTQLLREAFMDQMKEQTNMVRTMLNETRTSMSAMKAEINALKAQVG